MNAFVLAVQREMLKDQSGSKGGSLAEALASYLQGKSLHHEIHFWTGSWTMFSYLGASKHADALFQDVLRRKDDADTMRNALSVLHRFRSLFSLPQIIEQNINQVDNYFVRDSMHKLWGGYDGT